MPAMFLAIQNKKGSIDIPPRTENFTLVSHYKKTS